MIIKTKALEHVLNIYCSASKIKEFEKKIGITIREALLKLGEEIGYLKLANKIYDLGLVFKPRNKSSSIKSKSEIETKYKEISEKELDLMQLVNGHDLSNFLYILMKKILKSKNKMLNDFSCVEDSLILAYDFSYFKETELFSQITNWSKANKIDFFEE